MSGNAASDLVLAIVCGWIVVTRLGRQPGLALAALLIGAAAALGTLWFSGIHLIAGPYRFLSLLSACAGFPLLAWSLRWPEDPIAAKITGAVSMILFIGGIGMAATLLSDSKSASVIAGLSALLIVITMVQRANLLGIAGVTSLIVAVVAAAIGSAAAFNATVVLHLGLATALGLFALASDRDARHKRSWLPDPTASGSGT